MIPKAFVQHRVLFEVLRQQVETGVGPQASRMSLLDRPHQGFGFSRLVRAETEYPFGDQSAFPTRAVNVNQRVVQVVT